VCNKKISYYKSQAPNKKYCSIQCRSNTSSKIKEKKCLNCKIIFAPKNHIQKYCGSIKNKIGCSFMLMPFLKKISRKNENKEKRQLRWKKYYKKIIKKRGYKNCVCGKTIENLNWKITFCKNCLKEKQQIQEEKRRIRLGNRRLKLRFLLLEKYNFTCQYCGRKSPECILEIDHRFPKSKLKIKINSVDNYTIACKECNLGKGDYILSEFIKTKKEF